MENADEETRRLNLDKGEIKELIESNPLLGDESFLAKYPGIEKIAVFLDSTAKIMIEQKRKYKRFTDLNIEDIRSYLELLANENPGAVKLYRDIKNILNY